MILYADTGTCGNSTYRITSDPPRAGGRQDKKFYIYTLKPSAHMLKCMQSGYMNLPGRADGSVIRCVRAGGRRRGGTFGWRAYFAHRAGAGLPVQLLSIYVASQTRLIA